MNRRILFIFSILFLIFFGVFFSPIAKANNSGVFSSIIFNPTFEYATSTGTGKITFSDNGSSDNLKGGIYQIMNAPECITEQDTTYQLPAEIISFQYSYTDGDWVNATKWEDWTPDFSHVGTPFCMASGEVPRYQYNFEKSISAPARSGPHTLYLKVTDKATYKGVDYSSSEERLYNFDVPVTSAPNVNISANPLSVNSGQSSVLTWTSSNTAGCAASSTPANSQWTGPVAINDSKTINNLTTNTIFSITCSNSTQSVSDQASVRVLPSSPTPTASLTPTPTISTTPTVGPSSIIVNSTLNGVDWTGDVDYAITGPQSFYASSTPQTFSDVQPGSYTLTYIGGGPAGYKLLGVSPAYSSFIDAGQTIQFTLQFGTAQICDIQVSETCGGASTSGNASYYLSGPSTFSGNYAPYTFQDIPVGVYYVAYVSGGPGTLQNVTPVNPQYCFPGQTTAFAMNFTDCGASHLACNNNQCVAVSGPGSNQCSTNDDCSGTCDASTPVKAGILCWGTKSSDPSPCVGRIDPKNLDNPSVILYNNSKGSKCVESCLWQVFDASTGLLKQNQKSCAPVPWYDQLGSYRAVLKITDKQGKSDSAERTFKIVDIDSLACDFAWDPTSPKSLSPVNFFDRSETPRNSTVKTWNWTFEDAAPASSKLQNPTGVQFNTIGEKTVQLIVANSIGQQAACSQKIQINKLIPHWKEIIP